MRVRLPNTVGGIKVERIVPSGQILEDVIMGSPPKAVVHDTEGSLESALAKFRSIDWPHSLIGRDTAKKIRIFEFAPMGAMGRALAHPLGTPETNRVVRVQVEIAGFRRIGKELLLAPDKKVMDNDFRNVLAELYEQFHVRAGVPLVRGGNGTRSMTRWLNKPGFFGHVEVPNNDHTDPGGHDYQKTFDLIPPWKLVVPQDGTVLVRGTLEELEAWQSKHRPKTRDLDGFNLRRNG